MANEDKQVFISHARKDADCGHRLADDLKRLGVRVWIAPESIRPGEEWVDAIERGLGESSHIVIVLTPAALQSRWVRKETNVAIALERQGDIHVIPLDVKPCKVPLLLSSYQMISFRRNYDAGLNQLANILALRVMPPEPMRALRQVARIIPVSAVSLTHLKLRRPFEPELILTPAGEFLMGSDPKKDKVAFKWEQPQHTLYLPNYYLAKTPVTNAQYAAFVEAVDHARPQHWEGRKPPKGKEDHPVVYVSWHDAVAHCNWLAQVPGKAYRLPSEAEWEKAARGTDGRIYPWGNEWDPERCNFLGGGREGTTPVGAYPEGASPYGVLDMSGNVWEWCHSLRKPYPYDAKDGREDPKASGDRVVRGGAFGSGQWHVRCADRYEDDPLDWCSHDGFRVCVAPRQE